MKLYDQSISGPDLVDSVSGAFEETRANQRGLHVHQCLAAARLSHTYFEAWQDWTVTVSVGTSHNALLLFEQTPNVMATFLESRAPHLWMADAEPSVDNTPTDALEVDANFPIAADARTPAQIASDIHDRSGLTWEQIARALGVSKRAVLLWVRGGRVNSRNHEALQSLWQLIDVMRGDAEQHRNALLAPNESGVSPLAAWSRSRVEGNRINAPVLNAIDLLG